MASASRSHPRQRASLPQLPRSGASSRDRYPECSLRASLPQLICVLRHYRSIALHPLPVKRGLGEPALTPMEAAFAGQQPLSEQALGTLQPSAFAESMVMSHQYVFD